MTINVDDDIIIHVFCPSKLCSCACCCECFKLKTKVVRYVTKKYKLLGWSCSTINSYNFIFLSQNLNSIQFEISQHNKMF
jgi:hypothetical protein